MWHKSVNEGFMWSLLQIFLKNFLLSFSLMKKPKQDNNGYAGSYAGCSNFCCENCRREELWGFRYRVEAQDITEPFQQLALQYKYNNLGLSCKYKYYSCILWKWTRSLPLNEQPKWLKKNTKKTHAWLGFEPWSLQWLEAMVCPLS